MSTTSGYNPSFLPVSVALPRPVDQTEAIELPYVHFTVLLDPARRLAAATGVNIDGAALVDVERADDWRLDPRIAATQQTGPELYARNDLDRGHLVRRRDPVWGDRVVAEAANGARHRRHPIPRRSDPTTILENRCLDNRRRFERAHVAVCRLRSRPGTFPRCHRPEPPSGRRRRLPSRTGPLPHLPSTHHRHRNPHRTEPRNPRERRPTPTIHRCPHVRPLDPTHTRLRHHPLTSSREIRR